jgi:hypothetical protein
VLPVVTTLTLGHTFEIHNNSSGSLTINSSGSNLVGTLQANTTATCTCILITGTTAASWDFDVTGFTSALPTTRGGTGLTSIGSSLQVLRTNTGATALEFATLSTGTSWQSVQTSGFTATAGYGYPCNTTSAAFTVTLPASPSVGDYVQIVDYAGTFATNNITLGANSNKINGVVANKNLTTNREAVTLVYVDSTQGWVSTSASNYGTVSLDPAPYSVDFLVVAGGGGGGGGIAGGGGAGGYRTSTQLVSAGTVITVTVGDGGTGGVGNANGTSGSTSSISGSGLTTITSAGGGYGGGYPNAGASGGSGGGSAWTGGTGGAGNTPSTSPSQGNNGGTGGTGGNRGGGGGGGASAVGTANSGAGGVAGGIGTQSSITGTAVYYAGGGGGGSDSGSVGAGGLGGGGNGAVNGGTGTAGTTNTGGGGGGGAAGGNGGAGGKGVVILSVPTASYSGTSTGSPTITTSGSNTILQFNGSGTYTG